MFGAAPPWEPTCDKAPVPRLTRTPVITAVINAPAQTTGLLNQRPVDELSSLPDGALLPPPSGVAGMTPSPPRRTSEMMGGPTCMPIVLVLTIDVCLRRVDVNERPCFLAGQWHRGLGPPSSRADGPRRCLLRSSSSTASRRS